MTFLEGVGAMTLGELAEVLELPLDVVVARLVAGLLVPPAPRRRARRRRRTRAPSSAPPACEPVAEPPPLELVHRRMGSTVKTSQMSWDIEQAKVAEKRVHLRIVTEDEQLDEGPAPRGKVKGVRRSSSLAENRITKDSIRIGRLLYPERVEHPRTRGECPPTRPCPFVGCKFNLYLDVDVRTGTIKLNFPELEPWQMVESCALDIADRGGITLESVSRVLNVTRERIRQIETHAEAELAKLPGSKVMLETVREA